MHRKLKLFRVNSTLWGSTQAWLRSCPGILLQSYCADGAWSCWRVKSWGDSDTEPRDRACKRKIGPTTAIDGHICLESSWRVRKRQFVAKNTSWEGKICSIGWLDALWRSKIRQNEAAVLQWGFQRGSREQRHNKRRNDPFCASWSTDDSWNGDDFTNWLTDGIEKLKK